MKLMLVATCGHALETILVVAAGPNEFDYVVTCKYCRASDYRLATNDEREEARESFMRAHDDWVRSYFG